MKLIPYLTFQGNAEEALFTYQKIFKGEIGQINRYDNPAMPVPDDYKNKIMHTELRFGDNIIMFTDAMPGNTVEYGNAYALNLAFNNVEMTTAVFNGLANGGTIAVPFAKQFWGSWFGQVTDSFGISWMLMCDAE